MTVKNSQKCPCVHIWVNSQNRQLTGFDLGSNFQLKCLNSRRVNLTYLSTIFFTYLYKVLTGNQNVNLRPTLLTVNTPPRPHQE